MLDPRAILPCMKRGLMASVATTGLAARCWAADLEGSWNVGGAEVSWPGSTCVVTYGPGDALQMLNQGPQNGKPGDPILRVEAVGTFILAGTDLKHTYSRRGLDASSR